MKIIAILTAPSCLVPSLDAAVMAAKIDPAARIEALHVIVDPEHLVAPSEEIQFQRLREKDEGTAQERDTIIHSAFLAWMAGAPEDAPTIGWWSLTGAEEASLVDATQDAGLLVLGHGHDMDSGDAFHAAIWATGKPVLLVPADWRPRSDHFAHIAVALSDTAIAAEAITGAMPWLCAAERVTAIRLGDPSDHAMNLLAMLNNAGITVDLHVVPLTDDNRGRQIVGEAEAIGADMLVAGAYRHGPLVEWLMGGTTRHMLAKAKLPMLLEHRASE